VTPAPNHRLLAARTAAQLTQESLADLANTQVEQDTGKLGAMDADYVSKLERGIHRWPGKDYRRALRAVLGAQTDLDLGFYSTRILELKVGDASQGIMYGEQALSAEAPLKSRRAKDDLAEVRKALSKRADVAGATELRSRLAQVLKSP
jgi:transcriptional regulator with XRE-family HTH domain